MLLLHSSSSLFSRAFCPGAPCGQGQDVYISSSSSVSSHLMSVAPLLFSCRETKQDLTRDCLYCCLVCLSVCTHARTLSGCYRDREPRRRLRHVGPVGGGNTIPRRVRRAPRYTYVTAIYTCTFVVCILRGPRSVWWLFFSGGFVLVLVTQVELQQLLCLVCIRYVDAMYMEVVYHVCVVFLPMPTSPVRGISDHVLLLSVCCEQLSFVFTGLWSLLSRCVLL